MREVIVHGLAGRLATVAGRQLGEDVQVARTQRTHQPAGSCGVARPGERGDLEQPVRDAAERGDHDEGTGTPCANARARR